LLGKSRQAYYKQCQTAVEKLDAEAIVVADVRQLRQSQPQIGARKIHELFRDTWAQQGLSIGRDRLLDILADNQLLIRRRKRLKPRTTFSHHGFLTYPDLLKHTEVERPHQVYVSDITYLRMADDSFCYLFLTTDAYSLAVVGYQLAKDLKMKHAVKAMQMAHKQRPAGENTIHHSDRGIQYCCPGFTNKMKKWNYQLSMTQNSDPRDNAIAERLNGILKHELIYPFGYPETFTKARSRVQKAVETYNYQRPHMSCDLKPPAIIHQGKWKPKRQWKSKTVNLF
jgi:transposase InsO family protein